MWGWRRKRALRRCANGHELAASWEACPYCPDLLLPEPSVAPSAALNGRGGGGEMTLLVDVAALSLESAQRRRGGATLGWIVALDGAHGGEDFRLKAGRNLIGSAAECEIVLTDVGISRRHCAIRCEGGDFLLVDLDSEGGVQVNGAPVQRHLLIDNDRLTLGEVAFKFKSVC